MNADFKMTQLFDVAKQFFDNKQNNNNNNNRFSASSVEFSPRFWYSLTGLDGGASLCEGEEQEEHPDHLQFHHGGPFGLVRSGPVCSAPDLFGSVGLHSTEPP